LGWSFIYSKDSTGSWKTLVYQGVSVEDISGIYKCPFNGFGTFKLPWIAGLNDSWYKEAFCDLGETWELWS
jgi:hypothetical protein